MDEPQAIILSVCISHKKGIPKTPKAVVKLIEGYGIEDDAHASYSSHRQVSLLAYESIIKMQRLGLNVRPGSFGENITTRGIELTQLHIGDRLKIGDDVIIEISQIGKVCHTRCAIYYKAGDCVMPREGVFARVIKGGLTQPGDAITMYSLVEQNKEQSLSEAGFMQTKTTLSERKDNL
jgi:molybdopterin adenylyltransferase